MNAAYDVLEVRWPEGTDRYHVDTAVFGAFRHCGDTVIVLTVSADDTNLSVVLPVAPFDLTPGSTWGTADERPGRPSDINVVSLFSDVDFRPVSRMRVEVLAGEGRTHRLRCTCGVAQTGRLSVEATFTFCGTRDHDGGSWRRYLTDQYSLSRRDGPLTEFEWLHTDRLRRVCREVYYPTRPPVVPPPVAPGPTASGPGAWLRRLIGRRAAASPTPAPLSPETRIRPTARQTKLLIAALAEHFLNAPDMARLYERYADGEETDDDRARVKDYDNLVRPGAVDVSSADNLLNARAVADHPNELFQLLLMEGGYQDMFVWRMVPERSAFGCDVLRDILGNPFRPTPTEPAWRTSTAIGLAEAIYAARAFDGMPILADALEEAGCTDTAVLDHCRNPAVHVRGCWVLDGLLARDPSLPPVRETP